MTTIELKSGVTERPKERCLNRSAFSTLILNSYFCLMNILDRPVPRHFDHGWNFPLRIRIIGFVFLLFALLQLLMGMYFIGGAMLFLALFISFSFSGVKIDVDNQQISEYIAYLGFIRISKKYSYLKLHYITVIPKRVSTAVSANMVQQTVDTNYKFSVCLFTESFRVKKTIVDFETKSEATEITTQLAHLLKMNYFEYDPQVVREKLTGRSV